MPLVGWGGDTHPQTSPTRYLRHLDPVACGAGVCPYTFCILAYENVSGENLTVRQNFGAMVGLLASDSLRTP